MKINEVFKQTSLAASLSSAEKQELLAYHRGEGSELSPELFEKVYEYYVNTGEMPYGTMKARDGDPYDWIDDRLSSMSEEQLMDMIGI